MAVPMHDAGQTSPLVSALMVTLPVASRYAFACASIQAFCAQSLANKELVLVLNGGTEAAREALRAYVAALARGDIRIIDVPGELCLGALRNISLEAARGEIVCQWDDDDLHHPERLQQQLQALQEGDYEAVFLQEVLQYFPQAHRLYWTNWGATPARGHPGTLMARAAASLRYPSAGPSARLGEDLQVALALQRQSRIGFLAARPYLFVYVSHGENSWNPEHHRRLIEELAISPGLLRRREAELRQGLRPFAFARGALQVIGSTGPAFVI